jgi:hypothetical protein
MMNPYIVMLIILIFGLILASPVLICDWLNRRRK